MLDERDLQAIKNIMDASIESAITASENRMEKKMESAIESAITASEKRMKKFVQETITKSESNLLDEIDRYQKINEKKFDKMQKDIDDLKAMHRMDKNDEEIVQILSTRVDHLEDRVDRLENNRPA